VEANTYYPSGIYDGVKNNVIATWNKVMVVCSCSAPSGGQLAKTNQGSGVDIFYREAPPDRVELNQPLEKIAAGSPASGNPLVKMVVRINETSRDDITVTVHYLVTGFCRNASHGGDPTIGDCHVAGIASTAQNEASSQRPQFLSRGSLIHGVQSAKVSIINRTSGPNGYRIGQVQPSVMY
jgi:hypothetical protein